MVTKKKTKKKKVAKKATKKSTKKTAKKSTKKKVAKSSKKTSKKVAKKTTKKQVKKTTSAKVAKKAKKTKKVKTIKKTAVPSTRAPKKAATPKLTIVKEVVPPEVILKEALNFLRTFNFLASDSDDCSEKKCDNPATTGAYCRLHYVKNWKEIKKKEHILTEGTLIKYIEELTDKFSYKVITVLSEDMADEKKFYNALKNMNIDVAEEFFDDSDDSSDESDIPFEAKNRTPIYDEE